MIEKVYNAFNPKTVFEGCWSLTAIGCLGLLVLFALFLVLALALGVADTIWNQPSE